MIGRSIVSFIVIVLAFASSSWLYMYTQAVKAEMMVKQLEDSNLTYATVRWLSGDLPSIVVFLVAGFILLLLWRKQIKQLITPTEKENEK